MTGVLEAFETYCRKHNIRSEQFKGDIFPAFAAGFVAGQHTIRRGLKEEESHGRLPRRNRPVY